MTGPLRTSSGLRVTMLEAARASVVAWLERGRTSGRHDLSAEAVETVARVAMLAVNDPMAQVYRAGVAAGRLAAFLIMGAPVPPGEPEPSCVCPHCGQLVDRL